MRRGGQFWARSATLPKVAWVAALCATGAVGAERLFPLVVTGDRVCLRARADGESEVVWQASAGTVVQGTGEGSNWVEVLAPAEASVWMAANLVSNGVVQVSRAHVRAGPGMNYPVVGDAQRDDKVEVRGEAYGWVKIGPPASCRLWVSRLYVKPAPEQKPAPSPPIPPPLQTASAPPHLAAAAPPARANVAASRSSDDPSPTGSVKAPVLPAPSSTPTVPQDVSAVTTQAVVKTATGAAERSGTGTNQPPVLPAALRRYEMDPDANQGRQALYRGTMDKCNWLLRKPADYRLLARHPRRGTVTLCYVSGDAVPLAALDGKRVTVSGREFRLKGIDRPVVVYESVVEDAPNLTGAGNEPIMP